MHTTPRRLEVRDDKANHCSPPDISCAYGLPCTCAGAGFGSKAGRFGIEGGGRISNQGRKTRVAVLSVDAVSFADSIGLSAGDVILEVNRGRVRNSEEFVSSLSRLSWGKDLVVLVIPKGSGGVGGGHLTVYMGGSLPSSDEAARKAAFAAALSGESHPSSGGKPDDSATTPSSHATLGLSLWANNPAVDRIYAGSRNGAVVGAVPP